MCQEVLFHKPNASVLNLTDVFFASGQNFRMFSLLGFDYRVHHQRLELKEELRRRWHQPKAEVGSDPQTPELLSLTERRFRIVIVFFRLPGPSSIRRGLSGVTPVRTSAALLPFLQKTLCIGNRLIPRQYINITEDEHTARCLMSYTTA